MYVTDDSAGWLRVAEASARAAGALALEKAREPFALQSKGFRDVVTDADFAAQRLIVDLIRDHFPTHGFLAEEKDPALRRGGQVTWVIDPIDGTSNYGRRIPLFSISVAAVSDGRVQAGAIYDPQEDALYSARRGHGAHCNGQPLAVSRVEPLDAATIAFDWSRPEAIRSQVVRSLDTLAHGVHTLRTFGSAALALAWIAAGRLDGYFNFQLGAWDVAAGALLIAEAGGRTSAQDGQPFAIDERASWVVSSNGAIHAELCATLAAPPAPGRA